MALKSPHITDLQNAMDVKSAIIAYMLDNDKVELHAGPDGAVKVLLDPDGFDLTVEKGRAGMVIRLIDKNDSPSVNIDAYRPPASTLPGFDSVDA